jgi:hypothetical protein
MCNHCAPNPNLTAALRWLRHYLRLRPGTHLSHPRLTPALYAVSATFAVPYPLLRQALTANLHRLSTPPPRPLHGRRTHCTVPLANARVFRSAGHGPLPR